jgi:DNA-binding CsgD family transcriptional regulator
MEFSSSLFPDHASLGTTAIPSAATTNDSRPAAMGTRKSSMTAGTPRRKLSAREMEVMDLLICGCTHSQIAAELSISTETVKSHLENAALKLGAGNKIMAVAAYALAEPDMVAFLLSFEFPRGRSARTRKGAASGKTSNAKPRDLATGAPVSVDAGAQASI